MNNDKPQLVERRGVYTSLNRLIFVLIGLLVFVILYPVVEWNIDCTNDSNCIYIKDILWQAVFILSAFHGDGLPITNSVDEQEGRSVIPLASMICVIYLITRGCKKQHA